MPAKRLSYNVCFCDIDGTLVHYPAVQDKWGEITGPSVVPGCFMYVQKVCNSASRTEGFAGDTLFTQ